MLHNLLQLTRYRALIQMLVVRELKARYRGSVLGYLWSFINPLLLLLIYSFVFTVVVPNRDERAQPYALFMFCGILPWTWFSASLSEASNSLIANGNLIKKVLFPAEVLPIVSVLANMVHFFLGLPILAAFLVWYAKPIHVSELIWFPVVVFVQLLFTTGLALIVSALTVHFRDIKDILANVLTLWFFATPIIYTWMMMEQYMGYLNWNPFTHLAISYQEILFFDGPFGHWKWLLALGGISVALCLVGYWLFDRLRDSYSEVV
ncbi:MAG: ABC transporter permease [Acidobacteria bacterium]|nr:ABC transporter permease [Acidobacteriota bacterium]